MDNFWADAEIIHSYTRAQAIEDGALFNLTMTAQEAGFRIPVAITAAAWAEAIAWDQDDFSQDEAGRMWDVVFMARVACAGATSAPRVDYRMVRVPNVKGAQEPEEITLSVHVGGGDHCEPVITIMLPYED
ncbi:DUF6573 family protein [Arthrobacter rhombi]|uniref:DUF6573 family protein n=1 Tax=Arthrobacter rhombi TaxID=71253 RepID=UPI003FD3B580